MDETKAAKGDSPPATGQTSEGAEGSTSTPKTRTYTEKDLEKAIEKTRSDVLAESGRKYKTLEDENASLKFQISTNQQMIQATEDKIAKLNEQISELSKDDPDKIRLTQRLRDLEDRESKLRQERNSLEAEKTTHADRVKRADKFEFEYNCTEIAEDYANGDSDKLKDLCEKLNATSKEQIRAVAEGIFSRKTEQKPEVPEITPDSGVTKGGGGMPTNEQIEKMSPEEYAEWASKRYK